MSLYSIYNMNFQCFYDVWNVVDVLFRLDFLKREKIMYR